MNRKRRLVKLNNAGMTLVEMLVSFVLLSIFMVSATAIIGSITNIYYDVKGSSEGLEVSNIIQNKLRGELETAKFIYPITEDGENSDIGAIKFMKTNGSVVTLTAEKKEGKSEYYFVEKFDAVTVGSEDEQYKSVGWKYDEATYMGYTVKKLKFSQAGADYPNNVYKVELVLGSPQWGEYSTERYVKCYRLP